VRERREDERLGLRRVGEHQLTAITAGENTNSPNIEHNTREYLEHESDLVLWEAVPFSVLVLSLYSSQFQQTHDRFHGRAASASIRSPHSMVYSRPHAQAQWRAILA